MSRFAEESVYVPHNIEVNVQDRVVSITGNLGVLVHRLHNVLDCKKVGRNIVLSFCSTNRLVNKKSLLGTTYALFRAMIFGVSVGFTKKLQLFGVGYRVSVEGNVLTLVVGFSHIVNYKVPDAVNIVCPSLVDIVLHSVNKQLIGQVAADLRSIRPPELFGGKGIRYLDEVIHLKDVKKK